VASETDSDSCGILTSTIIVFPVPFFPGLG